MRVCVIGAGSWGTAVARVLGNKGFETSLWCHTPSVADAINTQHRNPRYLCDIELPATIRATSSFQAAVEGARAIFIVTPSYAARETARSIAPFVDPATPVAMLSKGVEKDTGCLLTQVLEQELGNPARIAAISGPNHAEEVSRDIPSATVVASSDPACAEFFQELLMGPSLRVYTSHDVTGVELCAAAKNIVAIFNGAACALGYGDNTSAMIMTRGLAEMSRLVLALGGDPLTCQGLAGMGDLIATCTSRHSRNRSLGELIAQGGTLEEFTARTHMVAEGANAAITVTDLAAKYAVELPMANALRAILWEGAAVQDIVYDLMMRPPKAELAGLEE